MGKKLKLIAPSFIISALLSAAVFAAFRYEALEPAERALLNIRFRMRGEMPHGGSVVIADIDEKSVKPEFLGRWPWPRAYQAMLVDQLNQYGANVIGYDVWFSEPETNVPLDGIRMAFLDNFEAMGLNDPQLEGKGKHEFLDNLKVFHDQILGAAFAGMPSPEDDAFGQELNPDKFFVDALKRNPNVILGYFFNIPETLDKHRGNLSQVYKTLAKSYDVANLEIPDAVKKDYARIRALLAQLKKDRKNHVSIEIQLSKVREVKAQFERSKKKTLESALNAPPEIYVALQKFYRFSNSLLVIDLINKISMTREDLEDDVDAIIEEKIGGMKSSAVPYERKPDSHIAFKRAFDITANIPEFNEVTKNFGHVTVEPDPDGVIRYIMAAVSFGDYLFPALSVKAAAMYMGLPITAVYNEAGEPPTLKIGERNIPLDSNGMLLINYYGAKEYPRYSVYDIIRPIFEPPSLEGVDEYFNEHFNQSPREYFIERYGREPEEGEIWGMVTSESFDDSPDTPMMYPIVDWEAERDFEKIYGVSPYDAFNGKVVLVGATATGIYDLRVTPFSENSPGVEIHAQVVDSIVSDNFLSRPREGKTYCVALIIGLAVLMGIIIPLTSPLGGAAIVIALTLGMAVFDYFFFFLGRGWWMPFIYPLVQMGGVFFAVTIFRYATEEREKRFIKDTFGRYLAPSVIEQLTKNPELVRLGGQSVEMTAFFSDIQGFSTISEKLGDPQLLVELLNDYLTEMAHVIEGYEGTIDKYEGDAIIAFWGAPIHFDDHALRACYACLDQQKKLAELREKWKKGGKWPEIVQNARVRMGLNSGEMVVGNMGSAGRMNYTIMGDSVNLAARLEGANKPYHTYMMISEYTYAKVKDYIDVRELDSLRVVGKTEPVKVYEILARKGQVDPHKRRIIEIYNEGLMAYKRRQWDAGIARFTEALNVDPDDGPSRTYMARCEDFKLEPPGDDWDGVYTLVAK